MLFGKLATLKSTSPRVDELREVVDDQEIAENRNLEQLDKAVLELVVVDLSIMLVIEAPTSPISKRRKHQAWPTSRNRHPAHSKIQEQKNKDKAGDRGQR